MSDFRIILPGRANRAPAGFTLAFWRGRRYYHLDTLSPTVVGGKEGSWGRANKVFPPACPSPTHRPYDDLIAVAMSGENGKVAMSDGKLLYVFAPKEKSSVHWEQISVLERPGVRRLSWGSKDQLILGGETLASIAIGQYLNDGIYLSVQWERGMAGGVALLDISPPHGIIASASLASRLVKVWVPGKEVLASR
ncbi:hypothetical protein BJ684DRAFT_19951, partial [Piptocephalis cylindrospora]